MTEIEAQPSAETPEPPTSEAPASEAPATPPPRQRSSAGPWLYGLGFLVLLGVEFYLWQHPYNPDGTVPDQVQALSGRLGELDTRVSQLEQRIGGAKLDQMASRLDALEKRPAGDTNALAARLSALEQKVGNESQLEARLDALSGRLDTLANKEQSSDTDIARRLDAAVQRMAAIEKATSQVTGLADRASRLARLQSAQVALEAGQPLGEIPGAPPALARFATVAPPTPASLRLAYPAAERAALDASSPEVQGKPFLDRVLARAQDLVTIRQGDRVIVGDEVAGILARARTAIMAGDVAGAVAAVSTLHGPAADAMADWLAQAQALLAARSALADMAAHA
jgi:hypothetical protein